jgi:hypothetical protein
MTNKYTLSKELVERIEKSLWLGRAMSTSHLDQEEFDAVLDELKDIKDAAAPYTATMPSEFEHAGFICRRVIGSLLGRRGSARSKYGWLLFDKATGVEEARLVPDSSGGVPRSQVKRYAEQLRRIDDKYKEKQP